MNKYRKLASNIVVLAIGQFSSKLLVYVMLRFYTSALGTAGFGDVNNIINASALLISVVTLSISEGVLRFALDKERDGSPVLSVGLNTAIIGLVLFAAACPLVGLIPMLKGYEWLIFMYVCTGSIKGICGIYTRARGKVTLYAVDGIITTLAMIIYNLLFLGVFKLGVLGYVLSVSLGDLTSIIFLNLTAKIYKDYKPIGKRGALAGAMLRYSVPLMPTTIMWWIINVSDTFMITAMIGSAANGIYSFAYKFPNLAAIAVGIFAQAWHMSAITERNSRTVSRFYSNIFAMLQTVVIVAAAGIMLLLRPIIMPFFGGAEWQSAYFYVPLLLCAVVFQSFNNFLSSIYEASKKTGHSLISACIGAGVNIVLNIILINWIGIVGAAVATLVSYIVVFIYRVFDTKKYLYMTINWSKMFMNLSLLSSMALITMFAEYGLFHNLMNALFFVLIMAINFTTIVKAIKMFIGRKKQDASEQAEE